MSSASNNREPIGYGQIFSDDDATPAVLSEPSLGSGQHSSSSRNHRSNQKLTSEGNTSSTSFFQSLGLAAGNISASMPEAQPDVVAVSNKSLPVIHSARNELVRDENDEDVLVLEDGGDLPTATTASNNSKNEQQQASAEECRLAVDDLPPVEHLVQTPRGVLVESGVVTNPERDQLAGRQVVEIDDPDTAPTRGCMSTVVRAAGAATYKVHKWVTAPFVGRGKKESSTLDDDDDQKKVGYEDYNPGTGYERVSRVRVSVRQSEGPKPPENPSAHLLAVNNDDEEYEENHSSRALLRAPKTRPPARGGGAGPMIATKKEREELLQSSSYPASKRPLSTISDGEVPTGSDKKQSSGFRGELDAILSDYGCPIQVDLDMMGTSGNAALTLSGPIRLISQAQGANPDNVARLDETALNMLEVLFLKHHHKTRRGAGHATSGGGGSGTGSGDENSGASSSIRLCSVRLSDIDFTPAVGNGFSRRREWSRQTDPTDEDNSIEEQQDEQQWMCEREEEVRSRVVNLFNSLISGCPGVTTISLSRSNLTPTDIISNVRFPTSGSLEILSLKDCSLADAHLSAFVRLAQKNLTERQHRSSANNRRSKTVTSPRSSSETATLDTLLGGLKKLEILGSFSQSSMAVLLRFMRDDLLTEVSPSPTGSLVTTQTPSIGSAEKKVAQSGGGGGDIAVLGTSTHTPRTSSGPVFRGMRLQELVIPASLSTFVRSSEFAKRLPLLLVNGRGVSVPSNRFGSMLDVAALPTETTPR